MEGKGGAIGRQLPYSPVKKPDMPAPRSGNLLEQAAKMFNQPSGKLNELAEKIPNPISALTNSRALK